MAPFAYCSQCWESHLSTKLSELGPKLNKYLNNSAWLEDWMLMLTVQPHRKRLSVKLMRGLQTSFSSWANVQTRPPSGAPGCLYVRVPPRRWPNRPSHFHRHKEQIKIIRLKCLIKTEMKVHYTRHPYRVDVVSFEMKHGLTGTSSVNTIPQVWCRMKMQGSHWLRRDACSPQSPFYCLTNTS